MLWNHCKADKYETNLRLKNSNSKKKILYNKKRNGTSKTVNFPALWEKNFFVNEKHFIALYNTVNQYIEKQPEFMSLII